MTINTTDRILDALDDCGLGVLQDAAGREVFRGSLASVQALAEMLGCSDSAARKAVHRLRMAGLVSVFDALDASIRRRRLYVTGEAL